MSSPIQYSKDAGSAVTRASAQRYHQEYQGQRQLGAENGIQVSVYDCGKPALKSSNQNHIGGPFLVDGNYRPLPTLLPRRRTRVTDYWRWKLFDSSTGDLTGDFKHRSLKARGRRS